MNQPNQSKEQKFIDIYNKYVDEIYQYIYIRTGFHIQQAEDITQDIFLSVYREMQHFKGLCSQRSWVYRITKNKLYDFYRKQYHHSVEIVALNEENEDPKQNLDEYLITTFQSKCVRECLSRLSEQYRILLILKYVEEKKVKDIAQIVDKSPKSVESMLNRARRAFIIVYQEQEDA